MINQIVAKALADLSDTNPKVVQAVITGHHYITICRETQTLRLSSGKTVEQDYDIIFIDFTRKMTYDEAEYLRIAQEMYDKISQIQEWYEC
ncbi:MAG: hypothetical protein ACTSX6_04665 [Candidatus Heimdallarchaeaceae archaeon]